MAAEAAAPAEVCPPDIETMRVTVRHALDESPQLGELDTLREMLRGHIEVLIPEVQALAGLPTADSKARVCALAGVTEAEMRLRMGPGDNPALRLAVVQRLARSVKALARHFELLSGEGGQLEQ